PDEMVAINRDNLPVREAGRDDGVGFGVAFLLTEVRHKNGAVDDEKIRVARGHDLFLKREWLRHGQFDDVELLALRRAEALQALQVLSEYLVVGITLVVFDRGDEAVRLVEASDVVDVAVRIISDDTVAHPQHLGYSEVVLEVL